MSSQARVLQKGGVIDAAKGCVVSYCACMFVF
jgi:hypothetical protein